MTYGLDLQAGLGLWRAELYGDWYRDPWSWPELKWLERRLNRFDLDKFVAKSGGKIDLRYEPSFHAISIPKSLIGVRPAVLQDPQSRFLYLSAVGAMVDQLHTELPEFVFGWRSRPSLASGVRKNQDEWGDYLARVREGSESDAGAQTDVTSFFASINLDRLSEDLEARVGRTASASIAISVARHHDSLATRAGLPQRSFGSSILANFFLSPVDDALAAGSKLITPVARWMDDIVLFGPESRLYTVLLNLEERMRTIGLESNASKSSIDSPEAVINKVDLESRGALLVRWDYQAGPASGAVQRAVRNIEDLGVIRELEEFTLANIRHMPRTHLRAVLLSLRANDIFDEEDAWRESLHYSPHGADYLSRYLRDAAYANQDGDSGLSFGLLNEWLVDFLDSDWAAVDWVKAQYALAVPTAETSEQLLDIMEHWLEYGVNAQLVAVAAQRLAARRPSTCRDIVQKRSDNCHDPAILRILSLSLLTTNASRQLVKNLVDRHPANTLLREALDETGWRRPAVDREFEIGASSDVTPRPENI